MLKSIILLLLYASGALSKCEESHELECQTSEKCVKLDYICDGDGDCDDSSDEDIHLCHAWRDKECPPGMIFCRSSNDTGHCVDVISACDDPLCKGAVDERLCSILKEGKLSSLNEVNLGVCPETGHIQCPTNGTCIPMDFICDGTQDCEDASEEAEDFCKAWRTGRCSGDKITCRKGSESSCVYRSTYCNDYDCEGSFDNRLCYMLSQQRIMPLSETRLRKRVEYREADKAKSLKKVGNFLLTVNHTLKHENCPPFYSLMGKECISAFFLANLTWGEAQAFCQTIKGSLYVPQDREDLHTVAKHLNRHDITVDFWLGGEYSYSSDWHWMNGDAIELGTYLWAVRHDTECKPREIFLDHVGRPYEANEGECYHYTQEPGTSGSCVAITYERFFFMSSEDCLLKKSPLCMLDSKSNTTKNDVEAVIP